MGRSGFQWVSGWFVSGALMIWAVLTLIWWRFYRRELQLAEVEKQLAADRARAAELERQAVDARLRALQAQIEPHFLFNTLANVVSLVDAHPADAKRMLERLIELLRASLSASRARHATLGQEFDLCRAYLEILSIRMGGRLRYDIAAAADLRGLPLPPMLLQPLIENAIQHGLEPKVDGGHVRLGAARTAEGLLEISVEDNGVGLRHDDARRRRRIVEPARSAGGAVRQPGAPDDRGCPSRNAGPACAAARTSAAGACPHRGAGRARLMPSALIADDEPHLAEYLRAQLAAAWPQLAIVDVVGSGSAAAAAIKQHRPDIAFLDIRMPGATGLEVARALSGPARPYVVFVTAYDQYAIEAFEADAVDYLLKPVAAERLARTVAKLQAQLAQPQPVGDLSALLAQLARQVEGRPQSLRWIRASKRTGDGEVTEQIAVGDVLYFQADDKYTCVYARDGDAVREWLIRIPLAELAAQLDAADFQQIHRSVIVNQHAVAGTRRDLAGKLHVRIRGHERELPVARQYAHLFQKM